MAGASLCSSSLLLSVVVVATAVVMVNGEQFDCTNYNPNICQLDAKLYCLTNSTLLTGSCDAKRAVCLQGATLDMTFAACGRSGSGSFDCSQYNPMICPKDAIPFCLNNGTVVIGSCKARRAVCREDQSIDDDFSACNQDKDTNGPSSTASTATATLSVLLPLLYALFRG